MSEGEVETMKAVESTFKFDFDWKAPKKEKKKESEEEAEEEVRKPISLYKSDFTQKGLVTIDFSETLLPLDSFFKEGVTLESINKNLSSLIEIEYKCQLDVDEDGIDGIK